ncbi:MAG: hypothetical protein R6W90_17730 [Ignavibacteriaceae bacterium]
MDENVLNKILSKYSATKEWMNQLTLSFDIKDMMLVNTAIVEAKQHTINITGCSSEKFHDSVELQLPEKDDYPILDSYYGHIDKIRMAHQ